MTGTSTPAPGRLPDALLPDALLLDALLLDAMDAGSGAAPVVQALTLLQLADPAGNAAGHAALPVAERDRRLLAFHAHRFGRELLAAQACASCGEVMELPLDAAALRTALGAATARTEIGAGAVRIAVRQATSADLLAALEGDDAQAQEAILLARCVAWPENLDIAAGTRAEAKAALERMHEAAEITIAADCPHCGGAQRVTLDIASFLWAELRREASLLLDEIDELARAYGWREAEILALTPARRRAYLERVRQ
jgi:hypothetical protein